MDRRHDTTLSPGGQHIDTIGSMMILFCGGKGIKRLGIRGR